MTARQMFVAVVAAVAGFAFAQLAGLDSGVADAVKSAICVEAPAPAE